MGHTNEYYNNKAVWLHIDSFVLIYMSCEMKFAKQRDLIPIKCSLFDKSEIVYCYDIMEGYEHFESIK